ncbi:RHS repeat protein, partial [Escherichia coli]|nr:RHS repeat protein [Escherichia coli]EER0019443.1 RHS repeat protein [Escherichia coli]EER3310066.1 RHS repeat protein [Escherichia coli]EER5644079.1 RHS repeat protein [Escherichia coli]EER7285771.1 RHS repeat protein [Escherichia coli]
AGSNAAYELTSTYTPAGQLQSQHLNSLVYDRDYGWNDNGDLVRISGPRQTREYGYSATGRLESVRTLAPDLDIRIPYATDPAGNRLPDPELHPDSTLTAWPDNRIAEDAHYVYHYDEYGRLTEKTDRIPTGVIRTTSGPTTTTTTASTAWCSTRGYSMASHWSRAATSTTRWDGEWRNGYGGGSVT